MATFSKGKWAFSEEGDIFSIEGESYYRYIANFLAGEKPFLPERAEARANARLIIAAPMMYSLLRSVVSDCYSLPHKLDNAISDLISRIDGKEA